MSLLWQKNIIYYKNGYVGVVELVYTTDLKSVEHNALAGSSPALDTKNLS